MFAVYAELPVMGDRLFDEHGDRIGREFLAAPADAYSPFYTPTSSPPATLV